MSEDIFQLSVINTIEKFINLKPDWDDLLKDQSSATPFQSWQWNYGFILANPKKVKLNILVLRQRSGSIIGIAPFQLRKINKTNLCILEFIGGRKSDYHNFLYDEDLKEFFFEKTVEWINKNKNWFLLNLTCLNFETANLLNQFSNWEFQKYEVCPIALLPDSIEEFENNISKILKSSVKRKLKQLQKSEGFSFKIATNKTEFNVFFDALVILHQKRQNEKGELGKFANKYFTESFKTMAYNLFEENILRLGILNIDNKPAAVNFNLRLHEKEYTYMGGIDSDFFSYRPGNILDYLMIKSAIEDGVNAYDFLQGDEKYKHDWINSVNQLYQIYTSRHEVVFSVLNGFLGLRNYIYKNELIRKLYNSAVKIYKRKKDPNKADDSVNDILNINNG